MRALVGHGTPKKDEAELMLAQTRPLAVAHNERCEAQSTIHKSAGPQVLAE